MSFINHFGLVRLRVTGNGDLKMTLYSLDDVNSEELIDLTMSASTNLIPSRLANFVDQRAYLEIKTEFMDEVFTISKIAIFVKPKATSYPE